MTNTNQLTREVIRFLQAEGHQAERISIEGRLVAKTRTGVDHFFGGVRKVTSYKRIKSSMQRGTADISATIGGRSVKIEIKVGRDKQSEHQKRYQQQIERAGGVYWIVKEWDGFMSLYNSRTW